LALLVIRPERAIEINPALHAVHLFAGQVRFVVTAIQDLPELASRGAYPGVSVRWRSSGIISGIMETRFGVNILREKVFRKVCALVGVSRHFGAMCAHGALHVHDAVNSVLFVNIFESLSGIKRPDAVRILAPDRKLGLSPWDAVKPSVSHSENERV
jgi:hypothetical protein